MNGHETVPEKKKKNYDIKTPFNQIQKQSVTKSVRNHSLYKTEHF